MIKNKDVITDPVLRDLSYKLAADIRDALCRNQSLVDTLGDADHLEGISVSAAASYYVQFIMQADEDAPKDAIKAHVHDLVEQAMESVLRTMEEEDND